MVTRSGRETAAQSATETTATP
jgi:hypothetical protein